MINRACPSPQSLNLMIRNTIPSFNCYCSIQKLWLEKLSWIPAEDNMSHIHEVSKAQVKGHLSQNGNNGPGVPGGGGVALPYETDGDACRKF